MFEGQTCTTHSGSHGLSELAGRTACSYKSWYRCSQSHLFLFVEFFHTAMQAKWQESTSQNKSSCDSPEIVLTACSFVGADTCFQGMSGHPVPGTAKCVCSKFGGKYGWSHRKNARRVSTFWLEHVCDTLPLALNLAWGFRDQHYAVPSPMIYLPSLFQVLPGYLLFSKSCHNHLTLRGPFREKGIPLRFCESFRNLSLTCVLLAHGPNIPCESNAGSNCWHLR